MWKRIAEHLPLLNVVAFLLQRERVERRERKTEKQADASVEHGESLTESMLDLFWRSPDGGGVGYSPMCRHGLTRSQRTDLIRSGIADCEDEIKRG
jgi:hypothetical protein